MDNILKDKKSFPKNVLRSPTKEEVQYVIARSKRIDISTFVFLIILASLAFVSSIFCFVEIFTHFFIEETYLFILLGLFLLGLGVCCYSCVKQIIYEHKQIKNGNFMVSSGIISEICFQTKRETTVHFKSMDGWEDGINYFFKGLNYHVGDNALFVALFGSDDKLHYRFLLPNPPHHLT